MMPSTSVPAKRPPRPKISDDIRQQIREAKGTMSADEAAKKFGVGRSSVNRFWMEPGEHHRCEARSKISNLDREGIVRMYRAGRSTTEIALMYNCAQNTISRVLLESGIRRRTPLTTKQAKNIERYYQMNFSYAEIAEKVGVKQGTVSSYIAEHKLANRIASRQNEQLLAAPLRLDGTPDLRPEKAIVVEEGPATEKEKTTVTSVGGLTFEREVRMTAKGTYGVYTVVNGKLDIEMFTANLEHDKEAIGIDVLNNLASELFTVHKMFKSDKAVNGEV